MKLQKVQKVGPSPLLHFAFCVLCMCELCGLLCLHLNSTKLFSSRGTGHKGYTLDTMSCAASVEPPLMDFTSAA